MQIIVLFNEQEDWWSDQADAYDFKVSLQGDIVYLRYGKLIVHPPSQKQNL